MEASTNSFVGRIGNSSFRRTDNQSVLRHYCWTSPKHVQARESVRSRTLFRRPVEVSGMVGLKKEDRPAPLPDTRIVYSGFTAVAMG